jgi:Xaa-Pro aminopeptidase
MMEIPTVLGELILAPGMVLAFEPNCAFGRHVANLGGTVIVTEHEPLELNPLTADVLDATAVAL